MLNLTSTTKGALQSGEVTSYHLYELTYDESQAPLRITDHSENVYYNGHTYEAWAIKHGQVRSTTDGQISPVNITIGNIDEDRLIQRYVEDYQMIGKPVTIMECFVGASDVVTVNYKIASIKAAKGTVVFGLSVGFEIFKLVVPRRIIRTHFCAWRYRDERCKYSGTTYYDCDYTFEACRFRKNLSNFGGFPGVTNRKLYF